MRNAFSVDVEDYFQVLAFESVVARENWPKYELRVRRNVDVILELMEQRNICGTFFILAWIAERAPAMIRQIARAGHEIASHGCMHEQVTTLTPEQFASDIRSSKAMLEDLGGVEVIGYRAPSYSINGSTPWAFPELAQAGYRYSSSIFRDGTISTECRRRRAFPTTHSEKGCWKSRLRQWRWRVGGCHAGVGASFAFGPMPCSALPSGT